MGGTLRVSLLGGFRPKPGDGFIVLTFNDREGDFSVKEGLDLGGGLMLVPIFDPKHLILKAVRVEGGLVVNTTGDESDADPNDDMCDVDLGTPGPQCTLRAAIEFANAKEERDTITFDIPTTDPGFDETGIPTIQPQKPLPKIEDPVIIDATTQSPKGRVELRGSSAGGNANGLHMTAGSSTVKGLVINGFQSGNGILIEGEHSNEILRCFIGTDKMGTFGMGNRVGVSIFHSGHNRIGGSELGDRNVISANNFNVLIRGTEATRNTVQNNFIGTDSGGARGLGNMGRGVWILGASGNTIVENVISGNLEKGVVITRGTANVVQDNRIGVNVEDKALGNAEDGVLLGAARQNRVSGNIISGNGSNGVQLVASDGNTIQGNCIGVAGTDCKEAVPNGGAGVLIARSSNNFIGGSESGNFIAFNRRAGVSVKGFRGNAILGNFIHDNGGLGIDLGGDGVTDNDGDDGDEGANGLQNFPVIGGAIAFEGNGTVIVGGIQNKPETRFRIEVFANKACDSSGLGEGESFMAGVEVKTGVDGKAGVRIELDSMLHTGTIITATATELGGTKDGRSFGSTSEFSDCVKVK